MATEYFKIGRLVATYGFGGELLLKHSLGKKTSLKGLRALFVEEKKESFIPWFIQSARIKTEDEVYVKFEGIGTKEAAHKLTQKEAWLPEEDFKKFSAKASPINLLGYTVTENGEALGTVLEVIEQPHQILCRIGYKGKEAFIPLHAETLLKVDRKASAIRVQLPPGLLEIYE